MHTSNQYEEVQKKIRQVISVYKTNFNETDRNERYKWEAIAWYNQHWDIEAENFPEMLKVSFEKTINLLASARYFPYKMIVEFAQDNPEYVREMFRELHKEELPLAERYLTFREKSRYLTEQVKKQNPDYQRLQHYQDLRAVMVYLCFQYPEKYYLFKSTMYTKFRDRIGFVENKQKPRVITWKVDNAAKLCELILEEVQKDTELIAMHKARLDDFCYKDEALHVLSMDIMYYGSTYMQEGDFLDMEEIVESSEYWPTRQEYDPNLSVDNWIAFLDEDKNDYPSTLVMLKAMLELGGEATCLKLEQYLGEHKSSCISRGKSLGQRVKKRYNLPACMDGEQERYFPIPFVGRSVLEDGKKLYAWRLRPELKKALELMDMNTTVMEELESTDVGPNTILYGPPGTGKTYHTVIYAVAIIEKKELAAVEKEPYADVLVRYNKYKAQGYIEFTTFHQSYSYEEFIEGIRPVIVEDTSKEMGDIRYKIEPGVFKKFCERAEAKPAKSFEEAWNLLVKAAKEQGAQYTFTRRTGTTIKAVLRNDDTFDVNWSGETGTKNVLKKDKIKQQWEKDSYSDRNALSGGTRWLFDANQAIIDELVSQFDMAKSDDDLKHKNYVFIIDEINRGNISKIFGELITLIEDSKRVGKQEGMTVRLPYSRQLFGVPENVYIIGTMNTADRSIAAIDTALRRRFLFREMLPDVNVLENVSVEDLRISDMLASLNKKIAVLYDREHTIGHAYFMPLKEEQTEDKLAEIFINNIIPLLQEYFYDDYEKIRMVLGDNKKDSDEVTFIIARDNRYIDLFGDVDLGMEKSVSYEINYEAFRNIESYRYI